MADPNPTSESEDPLGVETPEAYLIPRSLAQATVDYLATRPYRDVFPLIRGFEALEPAQKPWDAQKPSDD